MVFNNRLKIVMSIIILVLLYFIYSGSNTIKIYSNTVELQKLQLKSKQNHIVIIDKENQKLLCDNERLLGILDSLPLGSPITDTLKISSKYGSRLNPLGKGWSFHSGLDIFAAWSDTVHASGNGIVKKAHWFGGYGRCVVISHIGEYESYYAHLYRIFVQQGDSIKKGQPIGRAGNSGAVTGPHLHYEIRRNGESTDPMKYIE